MPIATFQKTNWEYKILSQLRFIGSGKLKAIIISERDDRRYKEEDIERLISSK